MLSTTLRFGFNTPKKCGKTSAGNSIYILKTYDNEFISEYKEYGLVPRKTLVLKLLKNIPNEYMWDFIRGYFDGDGCIHFHKVKNRINSYQGEFSLLGTLDVLTEIHNFMKIEGIESSVKKYKDGKIYVLTIRKFKDLEKNYQKLYYNTNILKINRKYAHYTDFIEIKKKSLHLQSEYIKREQKPRLSKNEFVNKMNIIYSSEGYDFSVSEYSKIRLNTKFICPIHGEVEQKITYLISGRGCPKCSQKYADSETFIEKAKQIHGDIYDYSKVEYINNKTKVCVVCPIHGEFWITPSNHLLGRGCKECGKIKQQENAKKRKEGANV